MLDRHQSQKVCCIQLRWCNARKQTNQTMEHGLNNARKQTNQTMEHGLNNARKQTNQTMEHGLNNARKYFIMFKANKPNNGAWAK